VRGWIRTTNSTILKVLRTSKGVEPFAPTAVGLSTVSALTHNLVQPRGIEPLSTVLQTAAMTTSAKVALYWWNLSGAFTCSACVSFTQFRPICTYSNPIFGGSRGNRTLLVKNLARIPRNPLLPPL